LKEQKLREYSLQLLFQFNFLKEISKEQLSFFKQEFPLSSKDILFIKNKVEKVVSSLDELDKIIEENIIGYEIERLQRVEKNILRLMIYELLFEEEEANLVFSEAIRLTKKFATKEASKFIHAVLDSVHRNKDKKDGA